MAKKKNTRKSKARARPPNKQANTIKRKQKAKIHHPAAAKKQKSAPRATSAYDIEGLLIDKLIESGTVAQNGTAIENLIYNATQKMEEIGYTYGFSVGREIALKQHGNEDFTTALARIGLHEALYHPFEDKLIVTSKHTDRDLPNIGKNIHLYEAGIIAGYLSSSTGVRISARESRCVYKNADSCQFIATPFTDQRLEPKISISSITNSISGEIIKNQFRHLDNEYYRILAYLPLLKQPIFEEVRKLLVLSGERIAQRTVKSDTQRIISSIANYFGVRQVSMAQARRGKRIIRLTFDSYNSVYPYTLIPTALISGLISSAYKTTTEVNVLTNKDNTYTTTIEFQENKIG